MTTVGESIYQESLAPIADPYDAGNNFALRVYVSSMGSMLQPIEDLVRDPNILLNPDATPESWIPWLSQFVGLNVQTVSDAVAARAAIKDPPHARRGTPDAIVQEVAQLLTGTKTIVVFERGVGGSGWHGRIATLTSETPDPAAVVAKIKAVKPAGELIDVETFAGGDWATLASTHATWSEVTTDFATWQDVIDDPSHT